MPLSLKSQPSICLVRNSNVALHEMNIQLYFFAKAEFTLGKNQNNMVTPPCPPHSAPLPPVPFFSNQAADLPEVASI